MRYIKLFWLIGSNNWLKLSEISTITYRNCQILVVLLFQIRDVNINSFIDFSYSGWQQALCCREIFFNNSYSFSYFIFRKFMYKPSFLFDKKVFFESPTSPLRKTVLSKFVNHWEAMSNVDDWKMDELFLIFFFCKSCLEDTFGDTFTIIILSQV